MLKSVLQPFPVGVRLRRHRRVFSPYQDLFRAVKKIQKFPSEVETLPVLYKTYSKILCISVFNLNFRPFSVGVRLWRSIRCLRLFETFSGALRKLENSNQKWSYCMFCIKFMQKLSACPYLSSPLYSITDEIRSIAKV